MTGTMVHEAPSPWQRLPVYAVGGLFQVGYAAGSDLLLVLSLQGRGVFDCLTGSRLARDHVKAHDFFDQIRLTASGIGPLEGQTVRVAGVYGGGLPLTTSDGWRLETGAPAWPAHSVFLSAPGSHEPIFIGDDGPCELRACGFSETGRSFVIATSCDLAMFTRTA